MAAIAGLGSCATCAAIKNADTDTAVAAKLLKKVSDADKNLVATLLPQPAPEGQVDIKA